MKCKQIFLGQFLVLCNICDDCTAQAYPLTTMEEAFRIFGSTLECIHAEFVDAYLDKKDLQIYVPCSKNVEGWKHYFPNARVNAESDAYDIIVGKLHHFAQLRKGGMLIVAQHIAPHALPRGLQKVHWTSTHTYLYRVTS